MFPHTYWTPRYWTGRYWPPTGIIVQLPYVGPIESHLWTDSLVAVISLADHLGAILSSTGVISATVDLDEAEALWISGEEPPSATLVREDLSAILGADALAVQMPVLYVSSEVMAELLHAAVVDGAIISVVSRED